MKSSTPRAWLAAVVLSLGLLGCSAESEPLYDHGPVHECTGEFLCPTTAYTGFDGQSTFKTPFSTSLENATWSVEDPTIAWVYTVSAPQSYKDFGASWAMVEPFKAGTTKIIATSGGKRLEATLVITQYQASIVAAGATRYYTPANPGGTREACVTCHGNVQGADHSPLEMEVFTDDEILKAVVDGAYPDGYVLKNVDHKWALTDEERAGIVPYLRSLAPKGFF